MYIQKNLLYLIPLVLSTILFADSLFDAYSDAGPAYGYDKYIILNPDIIYQGGIGIYEGDIYIDGSGAVIDLQEGSGIWVYGDNSSMGTLTMDRCTVVNGGAYALNYSGLSTGALLNCNIVNCFMGIQLMDTTTVEITNCNIVDNEMYGVAVYTTTPTAVINYCNAWNNGEDYMENCPGWGNIWTPLVPLPGDGLLYDDPYFMDPLEFNYDLSEFSPCIDSGDPEILDPDGTISDIGAEFYYQTIIPSGDCNNDGILNILDIIGIVNDCILCEDGDECPDCSCGDVNLDDVTNVLDIILIVNSILSR